MELTQDIWAFVIALAAVVNGLGIVRLLSSFSEYLKKRTSLNVRHYWVYALLAAFQLFTHLLLWWSILGLRAAGEINFLSYLYLLIGPTLLFLGTSILIPEAIDESVDLRAEYFGFRKIYSSILTGFWLWAIFLWPAFGYPFAPTVSLLLIWLLIALGMRSTENPTVQGTLVIANFVVAVSFIGIFAMELGGVGRKMVE